MSICQYLWRGLKVEDGHEIYDNRHKTRVLSQHLNMCELPPLWNYDGSSTRQASTNQSVVHLIPVRLYSHPSLSNAFLTLCRTSLPADTITKSYEKMKDDKSQLILGFELECFVISNKTLKPLGYVDNAHQCTDHYCGMNNKIDYRLQKFLDEVLETGLKMGISLTGHNIEVAYGQIELQVCDIALKACDDLEVLKYLMAYIGSKPEYNIHIDYRCKVLGPDHNGSGMHTNFSTLEMREKNSEEFTRSIVEKLGAKHEEAMKVYGIDNEKRLTGKHETSSYTEFTYAMNSRAVSVRGQSKYDPNTNTIVGDYTYVEDRRPNPTADQYEIAMHIYDSIHF